MSCDSGSQSLLRKSKSHVSVVPFPTLKITCSLNTPLWSHQHYTSTLLEIKRRCHSPNSNMTQLTIQSMMPISTISMTPLSPSPSEIRRCQELQRRKHFCIFLKILSHNLSKTNPSMKQKVKELVRLCTKKNREGDAMFADLMECVQERLLQLVGQRQWRQCLVYTECYLLSRNLNEGGMSKSVQPI